MSDREAAIRDSFPRYDKLLAELAAVRERERLLREALDAAMQYVPLKDHAWLEGLADGEGET